MKRGIAVKKLFSWFKSNLTYTYLIVAFLVAFAFLANTLITIQLKFENTSLENEISELENRIKAAKQDLQKANTDAYIEEQATKRLGMVKGAEIPVKIYEVESEADTSEDTEFTKQDKLRIYLKDWYNGIVKFVN